MQISEIRPAEARPDEQLLAAFREFERASDTLSRSYQALECRVAKLDGELTRARRGEESERAAAERLAARLTLLLEVLPAGVVALDGDGRITECNPAARRMLGPAVIEGGRWREVAAELFDPRPDDGPDLRLGDGRRVHLATCSLGAAPGQLLLLTDVTETRELQRRIEGMRRVSQLGDVAAALAHQIRTPLSSALLEASAARMRAARVGGADAERVRDALTRIGATLGRLERLVGDLLAFARRGEFTVERFDLAAALAERFAARAERGVEIEFLGASGAWIDGCREALASAAENLVTNAVQAGARRIRIALAPGAAERIVVRVQDDGPGIDPAERVRVFEPFATSREGGTGLGLAIVRGVIESHGGEVEVEDSPLGGACFRVVLPAAGAPHPRSAAKE